MKVAIVSYGMGNLGSVRRALEDLGAEPYLAKDPSQLATADRIILPGVGAFGEAMGRLHEVGWPDALRRHAVEGAIPLLGICLGMQILANSSEEHGFHVGLGLIPGRVRRLDTLGCTLRVPHVGWNEVTHSDRSSRSPLFDGIPDGTDFYFVHSYAFEAEQANCVSATALYGVPITAAVWKGNCLGTQFHPEKSSKAGRRLIKNFLDYVPC